MSLLFALFTLAHQNATQPKLPEPNKVVITVNGHPITAKQVEAYLWDWDAPRIGQTIALWEVIHQEAAKHGIHLKEEEVKAGIATDVSQLMSRAPQGVKVDDFLKQNNISRSQIEFRVRAQMLLKEIAALNFSPNGFYKVATLIIRPKSSEKADVDAAMAIGNAAYVQLSKGDPWEKVLKASATDSQNIPNNGDLGWISLEQFPPDCKAELMNSKPGGFTHPIQTKNGVQIFLMEALGKDAKGDELNLLKARYQATAERDVLTKLQSAAKIVYSY